MLNMVTLVGRILEDINKNENEENYIKIRITVPRSYKNIDGIYENDDIDIYIYNNLANQMLEYCKKGDLVGIKGKIQNDNNKLKIIAEKITFLSNSKE
jgi:single-strand DNA-binding protein